MWKWMMAALTGCALAAVPTAGAAEEADSLEKGFIAPPDSARPWVYWFVMDGNFSREGITADLEAMKRAGIGGLIFMEVNVGIPRGPVKFMSPEWRQLFKHAVAEAERLGLQVTLNAGPGWTGSGGPWVKPEQSMQHVVAGAVEVTGPKRFDEVLPRPQRWPAFFGDGHLPPELEKAKNDFYRDLVVLAFPTPSGHPRIADIDEKALYVRAPYSSRPHVKPFLPAPANYPALPPEAAIAADHIVDLTARLAADGRLAWDVPEGRWTILRFGRTSTGATTRPAPAPGLGLECDKMDPAALEAHFDAFIGALLREIGPRQQSAEAGWNMLHIDSWEMGAQNWTAAFRDEFRRRRGYDPVRYLPAVTGRVVVSLEVSERFLWDLRQTAKELVIENHAEHLKALGRRYGFGLSIEPYDMTPCGDLSLGAVADVPMAEFWLYGFNTFYSVIEATSIAHTCGRRVVAAEAFTSNAAERWQAHPASMKALGDWALCAGVNRFVFHRFQHQPWLDRRPGMTFGPYGVHWDRTQTWWEMVPAYHAYVARCQFMLRQGLSVADVCYLAAEGAPQVFQPPASAVRGNPPDRTGYNFDGCAPETLLARLSVKDGQLVLPDGMSYRVLVLPDRDTMTPALLRKVKELVEDGATVIGPRPLKSPSLSGYPQCDEEVHALAEALWGQGKVLTGKTAEQVLRERGVREDFTAADNLRYTHRVVGDTDLFFVANPQPHAVETVGTFRATGKPPEFWWPDTGRLERAAAFEEKDGCTRVPLSLDPHGSVFVVFRKPAAPIDPVVAVSRGGKSVLLPALEVGGPWDVRFQPHRGAPERIRLDRLIDWSKHADPGVKYFSGTAVYLKTFAVPPAMLGKGRRVYLDLGKVQVMAQVKVNGQDVGILWKSPFRVDVTEAVKTGENALEITVANLWPNRLIGDQSLPAEKRVAWTTWNPFKKDTPLLESGLLGPVTLRAAETVVVQP